MTVWPVGSGLATPTMFHGVKLECILAHDEEGEDLAKEYSRAQDPRDLSDPSVRAAVSIARSITGTWRL